MTSGETDQRTTTTQRVIVVERRSLLADFAGIWLVALPVLVAFVFCLPRQDHAEIERKELNLPPTGWSKPKLLAVAMHPENPAGLNQPETSFNQNTKNQPPEKVNRIELSQNHHEIQKDQKKAGPPDNELKSEPVIKTELPNGVVVLNNSVNQLNPVAVFDPDQKAAAENKAKAGDLNNHAKNENQQPAPALAGDETGAALAEIQQAADSARNAKQADAAIKPLLALHDAEKAKMKAIELQSSLRQRAERTRQPFLANLTSILAQPGSADERSNAIEQLMFEDMKGIDPRFFQTTISDLQSPKNSLSTARKIRILRGSFVPESIILAYLADLEKKDGGKSRGSARNHADAIIRAGRMLLTNSAEFMK